MTRSGTRLLAGLLLLASPAVAAGVRAPARILSRDHHVAVKSIAPASDGRTVQLYLRERIKAGAAPDPGKLVLFVHGAGTPAEVAFDAPYADYSWMAYLAKAGYDVFAVDMEGYGRSQRPKSMNDKCNLNQAQRTLYKVPADCTPTRTSGVTAMVSDWNDVGAAVDYVLHLRHAARLNLVAWSQGGPRAGGWAAQHPDKVNRMVLLAPEAPPSIEHPSASRPAAFNVQTHEDFLALWNRQAPCPSQYEAKAADAIWRAMLASDPVGASWDPPARRAPATAPGPGWTTEMTKTIQIPTLFVSGGVDGQRKPQIVRDLYADFDGDKAFIDLACSSHNAMWEKNHLLLFAASREWLDHGTIDGQKNAMLKLGY